MKVSGLQQLLLLLVCLTDPLLSSSSNLLHKASEEKETRPLPGFNDQSLEPASSPGSIDSDLDRQQEEFLLQVQRGYAYWEQLHTSRQVLQKLWKTNFHQKLQNKVFSLTTDCMNSLEQVMADSSKASVLQDAIGQSVVGIADGSMDVAEAFDECFLHKYTSFCFSSNLTARAAGTTSWEVGLCVPKYCNEEDLRAVLREAGDFDVSSLVCTNSKHSSYSMGAKAMITITIFIAGLVLVGTVIDALFQVPAFQRHF